MNTPRRIQSLRGRLGLIAALSLLVVACGDSGSNYDLGHMMNGSADLTFVFPKMCNDKMLDGDETDIDCGGSCPPCASGKSCLHSKDCATNVCANNRCAGASCMDGAKNGSETDIDCGGPMCPKCDQGKMCLGANDCLSSNCINNVCQASQCMDGKKDGMETDIDCGGGQCPGCGDGKMCLFPTDCQGNTCVNNQCKGGCMADLQSDPNNCGTCNNACPNAMPFCSGGMCVVADKGLIGSYNVGTGPAAGGNPATMTCLEACAMVFGGLSTDYSCSTTGNGINHLAFMDGWLDPSHCQGNPLQENYKKSAHYSCGGQGCSYSAFVKDNAQCAMATNWCYK